MEKVLLSLIVASGLCAVERQYHFVYDPKNMSEALSYCRQTYTDLATVENMEDVENLNNLVDLTKVPYGRMAWIGLYDDVNSWRWSLSDEGFYREGETEFRNWLSGEPNNENSGENCGRIQDDGLWNDSPCSQSYKAVCFDVRGPTFVLTNNSMTWTEAQTHCRAHFTDLVSIRNMTDNQKVQELVPAGQYVWIGLSRDSWKWTDGSASTFRHWDVGDREPNNHGKNEECVMVNFDHSGKWSDWSCNEMRAFICYSELVLTTKQVIRLKLQKKNSSLDLNDPAVMVEITKQLQQRLKDQWVDGDIKLSWRKQSDGKVFHKDEGDERGDKEEKCSLKKDEC